MKKMKRLMKLSLLLALTIVMLTACSSPDTNEPASVDSGNAIDPIEINLGHVLAPDSPGHKSAVFFAEELDKRSDGAIKVNIYPNSELGSDRELVESMGLGAVDMALSGCAVGSPFEPRLGIFNMPFLFADREEAQAIVDSEAVAEIFEAFEKSASIHILTNLETGGFRQLATREKQVKTLSDLKSLKIRIPQSEFYTQIWNTMGCTGVSLAWSELYSGLQNGVVDGCEAPLANYSASGFAEVTKYFTYTNYSYDAAFLACSQIFWDKLTPVQQKLMEEVAAETTKYGRDLINDLQTEMQKTAEATGIVFNELTDDAKAEFISAVQPMYDSYAYPDDLKLIEDTKKSLGFN